MLASIAEREQARVHSHAKIVIINEKNNDSLNFFL